MAKAKKSRQIKLNIRSLDFVLLATTFILLALGIISVLSASAPRALADTGNSFHYFNNQILFTLVGIIIMFVLSVVDYHKYQKHYFGIYLLSIAALLAVLVFGRESHGAKRWIYIGSFSIQPSELAKIGIIIFYAGFLTQNKEKIKSFKSGFLLPILYLAPIIVILFFGQNHLSATIIMIALTAILMFLAGSKISHFILCGIPLVGLRSDVSILKWRIQTSKNLYLISSI